MSVIRKLQNDQWLPYHWARLLIFCLNTQVKVTGRNQHHLAVPNRVSANPLLHVTNVCMCVKYVERGTDNLFQVIIHTLEDSSGSH